MSTCAYWRDDRPPEDFAAWVEGYWTSVEAPHRAMIRSILRDLGPFASLLEAGCHVGPNLRMVHAHWPEVRLAGFDVNASVVAEARTRLSGMAEVREGALPACPFDGAWDVVLTCYTLAYVSPEQVGEALDGLWQRTAKALVVVEPHAYTLRRGAETLADFQPWTFQTTNYAEWAHDYRQTIARLGWATGPITFYPCQFPDSNLSAALILTRPGTETRGAA